MRIAIPIAGFGPAGGNRVLSRLATEWTRLGHTVRFFVHRSSGPLYHPTDAEIVWLDDAGRQVAGSANLAGLPWRGAKYQATRARALRNGLRRYAHDDDVVLANHSMTVWPALLARVRGRTVYYVQLYEPELIYSSSWWRTHLSRAVVASSYLLPYRRIVNSPIYFRYGVLRARHFVPPGLDFGVYHPGHRPLLESRPIVLGCIGRQDPSKGTRYVLEAYRQLRRAGAPVELNVAYHLPGDFAELPGCTVVFPNNDSELADYYRSVDVLIAPGTVQLGAAHYPVMEPMACGIPVITTGYLPADESNAWIVPVHDASAIADAVMAILRDPDEARRRAAKGLEDIRPFGWEAVARRMLDCMLE